MLLEPRPSSRNWALSLEDGAERRDKRRAQQGPSRGPSLARHWPDNHPGQRCVWGEVGWGGGVGGGG